MPTENQINPTNEKIRILLVKKTQRYYAKKLNRTPAAISQALSGQNNTLLARIKKHTDYLIQKNQSTVSTQNRDIAEAGKATIEPCVIKPEDVNHVPLVKNSNEK